MKCWSPKYCFTNMNKKCCYEWILYQWRMFWLWAGQAKQRKFKETTSKNIYQSCFHAFTGGINVQLCEGFTTPEQDTHLNLHTYETKTVSSEHSGENVERFHPRLWCIHTSAPLLSQCQSAPLSVPSSAAILSPFPWDASWWGCSCRMNSSRIFCADTDVTSTTSSSKSVTCTPPWPAQPSSPAWTRWKFVAGSAWLEVRPWG